MATRRAGRGNTLIEILVVLVVIGILAGAYYQWIGGRGGGKTEAERKAKTPIGRAKGVECANNMQQIAMALQMASMNSEQPPRDIRDALKHGVASSMMACPQTRQSYRFDPAQRRVICSTPGHPPVPVQGQNF